MNIYSDINGLVRAAVVIISTMAMPNYILASDPSSVRVETLASPDRNHGANTATSAVLVLGQVQTAGPYGPQRGSRLLDVIRMAGGFTPAAKSNAVQVVRKSADGTSVMIVADCNAPLKENSKEKPNGLFAIEPGDKIFVPEAPR